MHNQLSHWQVTAAAVLFPTDKGMFFQEQDTNTQYQLKRKKLFANSTPQLTSHETVRPRFHKH
jgi:hypothetical protein